MSKVSAFAPARRAGAGEASIVSRDNCSISAADPDPVAAGLNGLAAGQTAEKSHVEWETPTQSTASARHPT